MGMRTVMKVQVNQVLVGNACFLGKLFEIIDNIDTETEGDLLFEMLCIGVFD
jgi:hypothetical protein